MYTINNEIIHDDKAMWDLALLLKTKYESTKHLILESEENGYMFFNGKILDKGTKEYKKVMDEHRSKLKVLESIIESNEASKLECHYTKYISKDPGTREK